MVELNYNDPVEVTEIYRITTTAPGKASLLDEQDEDDEEDEDEVIMLETTKEYSCKTAVGWEDIRGLREYPVKDEWKQYKGPKFYLKIESDDDMILCLGDYRSMLKHWTTFRNTYPLFKS